MDIERYLARIGYAGARAPAAPTLAALQRAHLFAVPFESLDCVRGRALSLDPQGLFDKIVTRRRGGFCFELNGLFSVLLRALGFDVTLLAARPFWDSGELAPERAHLALLVDVDDTRWLTDVGFGHFTFTEPLSLDEPGDQRRGRRIYRVAREGELLRMTFSFDGAAGSPRGYAFTLEPRFLEDFVPRCVAYSTDPDSPFARSGVFTRHHPGGATTVTRTRMIRTIGGVETETPVAGDEEWRALLAEHFGVTV